MEKSQVKMEREYLRDRLKDYGNISFFWAFFEQGRNSIKALKKQRENIGVGEEISLSHLGYMPLAMSDKDLFEIQTKTAQSANTCAKLIHEYRGKYKDAADAMAPELNHMEKECNEFIEKGISVRLYWPIVPYPPVPLASSGRASPFQGPPGLRSLLCPWPWPPL
jgi:hypothetical protein